MPLPGAAWVPQAQAQLTPAATPNGGAMPHSAIAYPTMQQFQVSPQVGFEEKLFIFFFLSLSQLGDACRLGSLTFFTFSPSLTRFTSFAFVARRVSAITVQSALVFFLFSLCENNKLHYALILTGGEKSEWERVEDS